jgi:hypothetical protein
MTVLYGSTIRLSGRDAGYCKFLEVTWRHRVTTGMVVTRSAPNSGFQHWEVQMYETNENTRKVPYVAPEIAVLGQVEDLTEWFGGGSGDLFWGDMV